MTAAAATPATAVTAGFRGADVAALDRVAARAGEGAGRLEATAAWTSTVVTSLRGTPWFTGPVGAAYATHLETVVVPWIRASAAAMQLVSEVLAAQAAQQVDASSDAGSYTTPVLPNGDTRDQPGTLPRGPDDTAARRSWWQWIVPDGDTLRDPWFWTGTGYGTVVSSLEAVRGHLVAQVRELRWRGGRFVTEVTDTYWRRGTPAALRRTSAEAWARAVDHPAFTKVARRGPFVITVAGQIATDWNDPELTAGHRIARVGGVLLFDGVGGTVGGAIGGVLGGVGGSAVAPGPGTAVGVVGGGLVGSTIGSTIGAEARERYGSDAIRWAGDRIDGMLDTVGGWLRTESPPPAVTPTAPPAAWQAPPLGATPPPGTSLGLDEPVFSDHLDSSLLSPVAAPVVTTPAPSPFFLDGATLGGDGGSPSPAAPTVTRPDLDDGGR